jgi:hypothetical protein
MCRWTVEIPFVLVVVLVLALKLRLNLSRRAEDDANDELERVRPGAKRESKAHALRS